MAQRRKVLSIVGPGRSGTTLLNSILGEVPGVFGAGELRWLWSRDLVEQRVCSCGAPPASCPVWSRVVESSLAVPPGRPPDASTARRLRELAAAQDQLNTLSRRFQVLADPARAPEAATRLLSEATADLLDGIFEVTGAHTVVDASKRPLEAAVMAGLPVDHYVLHVVRDPRAVVHSWRRAKPLPAGTGQAAMAPRSQAKTVWRWVERAVGADLLHRRVPQDRWLFLRYEDFAARPRDTVRQVLRLIGEQGDGPFTDDHTVVIGPQHVLSGNPDRFRTGAVTIRPDVQWRDHLSARDVAFVDAATLPFLLRHHYPLRPGRNGAGPD